MHAMQLHLSRTPFPLPVECLFRYSIRVGRLKDRAGHHVS